MSQIIRFGEEIAKPVLAGRIVGQRFTHLGEGLYGTAFPLGGARFMTALHVTASALATGGQIHVGWAHEDDRISHDSAVTVDAAIVVQEWPDVDLAAIEVRGVTYRAISWLTTEVASVLTPVRTVGYPFGFDVEERSMTQRAFAGTVWTCPGFVDTWVKLPALRVPAVARTLGG